LRMNCGSIDVHNRQELSHARDLRRTHAKPRRVITQFATTGGVVLRLGVCEVFLKVSGKSTGEEITLSADRT
jgi:hypothetical protein